MINILKTFSLLNAQLLYEHYCYEVSCNIDVIMYNGKYLKIYKTMQLMILEHICIITYPSLKGDSAGNARF